jgi:pimeloyl-ACP methyl ester carboxylesterase
VREELARIAADVPPASVAWAQRAMAARPDSTDVLAAARVPVLIVVGERDAVTPPAAAQDMARVAQDVELVELPGVAHLTPAEDPPGFADALTGWLTRHF